MTTAQNIEPVWYAFKGGDYTGELPNYYDASEFPWAAEVESKFQEYKQEIETYLKAENSPMEPYFNSAMVDKPQSWQVSMFYIWGKSKPENLAKVPKLDALFKSIPNLVSASISMLQPNSDIKEHHGDTSAVIRCHVGLQIPAGLPDCGIEVTGEQRAWEEGKVLMFCDAQKHRAFNLTDQNRYILIIDILHPNYVKQRKNVCANILSVFWLQKLMLRMKFLNAMPGFVKGGIRVFCKGLILLFAPPK